MKNRFSIYTFAALVAAFLALGWTVFADKVTGPLIRNNSADTYATHDAALGKGGHATVPSITNLSSFQYTAGMFASQSASNNFLMLGWDGVTWVQFWPATNDVQGFLAGWTNTLPTNYIAQSMAINVKDSQWAGGAKGDGTTDDTAAFAAALNYASNSLTGGVVFVPNGRYKITSSLNIWDGRTLQGAGPGNVDQKSYDASGNYRTTVGGTYLIGYMTNSSLLIVNGLNTKVQNLYAGYAVMQPPTATGSDVIQLGTTANGAVHNYFDHLVLGRGARAIHGILSYASEFPSVWIENASLKSVQMDRGELNHFGQLYIQNVNTVSGIQVDATNITTSVSTVTVAYTNGLPAQFRVGALVTASGLTWGSLGTNNQRCFITAVTTTNFTFGLPSAPGSAATDTVAATPGNFYVNAGDQNGPMVYLNAETRIDALTTEIVNLTNQFGSQLVYVDTNGRLTVGQWHTEEVSFQAGQNTCALYNNNARGVVIDDWKFENVGLGPNGIVDLIYNVGATRTKVINVSLAGNYHPNGNLYLAYSTVANYNAEMGVPTSVTGSSANADGNYDGIANAVFNQNGPLAAAFPYLTSDTRWNIDSTGATDASAGLKAMFAAGNPSSAVRKRAVLSGTFYMGMTNEIVIGSNWTIDARDAVFTFPTTVPGTAGTYQTNRIFVFNDATNIVWMGGGGQGYACNMRASNPLTNNWTMLQNPQFLSFIAATNGCENILVDGLKLSQFGCAIHFIGQGNGLYYESAANTVPNRNIRIQNCDLFRCGQPCYNYDTGYQWTAYSGNYTANQVAWILANPPGNGVYVTNITITNATTFIAFDNTTNAVPFPQDNLDAQSSTTGKYQVSFFPLNGNALPTPLIAGKRYFVTSSATNGITISTTGTNGTAVSFTSAGTNGTFGLMWNLSNTGIRNYISYKVAFNYDGPICIANATNVVIHNCRMSSYGDNFFASCVDHLFLTANKFESSEMGGVVCNDNCTTVNITGNEITYLPTDGSRCFSLEGDANVLIEGNTINGGGRGCLFNGNRDFRLIGNVFSNNTTKAYPDWTTGCNGVLQYVSPTQWSSAGTCYQWENNYVINIGAGGVGTGTYGPYVIDGNTFDEDSATYFVYVGTPLNGLKVTRNTFRGTSNNRLTVIYPPQTNSPTPPVIYFQNPAIPLDISANSGMETEQTLTYTTTLTSSGITTLTIPHNLPFLFPSGTNYGSYSTTGTAPVNSGVNYFVSAQPGANSPAVTASGDGSNVYISYAAGFATNVALSYVITVKAVPTTEVSLNNDATGNALLYDYLRRLRVAGARFTPQQLSALSTFVSSLSSIGYTKFLEVGPFFYYPNTYACMEKLKYVTEPQWRNSGGLFTTLGESTRPYFTPGDSTLRGLVGDGLYKSLTTSVTPASIGNGYVGGLSVYINNSANYTNAAGQWLAGQNDGSQEYGLQFSSSSSMAAFWGGTTSTAATVGPPFPAPALYTANRSATNVMNLYKNGVLLNTAAANVAITPSTYPMRIFGRVAGSGFGNSPCNATIDWVIIDNGTLATADYLALYNACTTMDTSFGRH